MSGTSTVTCSVKLNTCEEESEGNTSPAVSLLWRMEPSWHTMTVSRYMSSWMRWCTELCRDRGWPGLRMQEAGTGVMMALNS